MATVIRNEVSKRSRYHIGKHRMLELKHFCLQYPIWKKKLREIDTASYRSPSFEQEIRSTDISDPVYRTVERRDDYLNKIDLVERCCKEAANDLSKYLLISVTEEKSYVNLEMEYGIPCCRDVFYEMYRRFFWLLDRSRD